MVLVCSICLPELNPTEPVIILGFGYKILELI
jgi:hypothetical protein